MAIHADDHTMGESLLLYLAPKVHPFVCADHCSRILVVPKYDRSTGVSPREKPGKLFNYIRPTAIRLSESEVELRCFPGKDYLFHFGSIVASFAHNQGRSVNIECTVPGDPECWSAIRSTGIVDVPVCRTAILGYVECLDQLSPDPEWIGSGSFMWKRFSPRIRDCLLVGCRHTYWGEIAGRIVTLLAEKGCRAVVYSGKLGSLHAEDVPNKTLATASGSIMPDGRRVQWENIFAESSNTFMRRGVHVTVPSVLQETHTWRCGLVMGERFVDPEIGHMADAAQQAGIIFSIVHIVSDSLSQRFPFDLSNERDARVVADRRLLCAELCALLEERLRQL